MRRCIYKKSDVRAHARTDGQTDDGRLCYEIDMSFLLKNETCIKTFWLSHLDKGPEFLCNLSCADYSNGLDSSVGRAADFGTGGPGFESHDRTLYHRCKMVLAAPRGGNLRVLLVWVCETVF